MLFLVLRPDDDRSTDAASQTRSSAAKTAPPTTGARPAPPVAKPVVVRIGVRAGEVVGGPKLHEVPYRKRVAIVVRSDAADHVHLHGYDLMRDVAPGRPARMGFVTRLSGRFELELEESRLSLGSIEVLP